MWSGDYYIYMNISIQARKVGGPNLELRTSLQKAHVVDVARVEYLSEESISYLAVS
jgi:hypothetical protein